MKALAFSEALCRQLGDITRDPTRSQRFFSRSSWSNYFMNSNHIGHGCRSRCQLCQPSLLEVAVASAIVNRWAVAEQVTGTFIQSGCGVFSFSEVRGFVSQRSRFFFIIFSSKIHDCDIIACTCSVFSCFLECETTARHSRRTLWWLNSRVWNTTAAQSVRDNRAGYRYPRRISKTVSATLWSGSKSRMAESVVAIAWTRMETTAPTTRVTTTLCRRQCTSRDTQTKSLD